MQYNSADGTYTVAVPTTIPRESIFQTMTYSEIVNITCVINSASPDFAWNCKTHRMVLIHSIITISVLYLHVHVQVQKSFDNHLHDDNGDGTCVALQLDRSQSNSSNCNFVIGYCAWAKDIQGSAIIETPSDDNPEVLAIAHIRK